jgi:hypothetical protein
MYSLKPPAIFVHRRVYQNASAVRRLERLLRAMGDLPVEDVEASDTEMIVERAEIYAHYIDEIARVSPETPVSLCSESPDAWHLLQDRLKMKTDRLFCCCGDARSRRSSLASTPLAESGITIRRSASRT